MSRIRKRGGCSLSNFHANVGSSLHPCVHFCVENREEPVAVVLVLEEKGGQGREGEGGEGESHARLLDLWILNSASPHQREENSTQKLSIICTRIAPQPPLTQGVTSMFYNIYVATNTT